MRIIYASNKEGYLGKDGKMLWKSPDDFKHFREKTMGGCLIVGRTTFEKDLGGKMLKGRDMFVVGTGYHTLEEAVALAKATNKDIWVIGGASIYRQLIYDCYEVHHSIINDDQIGDVSFEIPADYKGKVFTYNFECK